MENEIEFSYTLKSVVMILIGSLLLGFFVTKGVSDYRKNHSVLDQIEPPVPSETGILTTILDLSSNEQPAEGEEVVALSVQSFVVEEYSTEDEIKSYYSQLPVYIEIPSIKLISDIEFARTRSVEVMGNEYKQWIAPDNVVGWHYDSALLGEIGNTVLNGHHNVYGEVFINLYKVQEGDEIILKSASSEHHYEVVATMILPERYETEKVRLQNARWIQTSEDERITLVTCWPYNSNTHRVIVVAYPIDRPTAQD